MIKIHYFAWVRERIGRDHETVDLPAGTAQVSDVIGWLSERGEGYRHAFEDGTRLRYAVDWQFVGDDASIINVRELAIFPPVTGG